MGPHPSVKQTIEKVEALTGCAVQIIQDSSIKSMARGDKLIHHSGKSQADYQEGQNMTKRVRGVVHGRTIELEQDLGVAEGEEVEVQVSTVCATPASRQPGEGFLRTEGALADDPHWDAIMEEIYRERKRETRRELSE